MLQTAFGDNCLSRSRIFEWYSRVKEGRTSIEDDPLSGRPTTSRTEELINSLRDLINTNRRLTIREIAEELGVSYGTCQTIITEDLGMRRISAKFVPRLLTPDQKDTRLTLSQEMMDRTAADPNFLPNIITGDETWVYGYDPETKQQSSQWKTPASPRPKKARQVKSNVKVMMVVFFDEAGVVHHEYAPHGQTVNQTYYLEVLRRLRDAVRRKRPEKWRRNSWFLHHDNAPAHRALSIREFLAKHNIPTVDHPPYSPDLAPADFFLFPKLKKSLKGQRFEAVEDIKENATTLLNTIHKEDYQRCFEKWTERWQHCVAVEGEYFEGD